MQHRATHRSQSLVIIINMTNRFIAYLLGNLHLMNSTFGRIQFTCMCVEAKHQEPACKLQAPDSTSHTSSVVPKMLTNVRERHGGSPKQLL